MRALPNKDGSITLVADNGADAYILEPFIYGVKVAAFWQSVPVSTPGNREPTTYPVLMIRPENPIEMREE